MQRSVSSEKVQLGVQHVGILLTILLRERAGIYCCISAGGSVRAAWETYYVLSMDTIY